MNRHLHKYKKLSEDELLKAYLEEGDESAYGELYSRYLPKLTAALNALLRDSSVPDKKYVFDEVIQKTLKNLHNSKSFKEGKIENYGVYLFKVLRNTFIAHCKETKKRTTNKDEYQRTQGLHVIEVNSDEEVEDDSHKVNEAIEKLGSENQKKVIHLRFWEGYSHRMIAQNTSIEEDNVRNYINRAKKALKKYLGQP